MLRQKFVNLFSSHQKLIHEAEVLCLLLRSYSVKAADVPRTLLQLGAKYKAILKHDRDVLQKQASLVKDEATCEQALRLMMAINKMLQHKHLSAVDAVAFENCALPEAQHFNDAIRFIAERDAYAKEVQLYLQDLKEDIATTRWKQAASEEDVRAQAKWKYESDDVSEQVDSDEAVAWVSGMPRPVEYINCVLADSEIKRDESAVGVLERYEEVKRHIENLRKEPRLHQQAYEFYRDHHEKIHSLHFMPLQEKSAGMIASRNPLISIN